MPLETLSKLEKAGDYHGMATGYLLRGEREQASSSLGRVSAASADVDSDRAVVALQRGALEEALTILEGVLEKAPNHAPALWNRGLVLRELGLDLLAAQSFAKVAALKEPGWSNEARERQAALERQSPRAAYPETPPVPEPINLDTWGFASTPLFPGAGSIYLTGFESPTDATRVYVYGVDVAQGRFLFAGTIDKRHVSQLLQRTGSDIAELEELRLSSAARWHRPAARRPSAGAPGVPGAQRPGLRAARLAAGLRGGPGGAQAAPLKRPLARLLSYGSAWASAG